MVPAKLPEALRRSLMRTLETVDRALRLLLAFDGQDEPELTVAVLAADLDVHRSSASRLAATLAQRGFLERARDGDAYRLGPAIARLGLAAMGARGLVPESREVMERLAAEIAETVVLSMLEGDETVSVSQAPGPHLISMRDWIGRRSPVHACSDGKVFLAFSTPQPARSSLPRLTAATITSRERLEEEIARVRRQGWASVEGEFEEDLNGVAVPVFDASDRCVAALSATGPAYRLTAERLDAIAPRVRLAAAEIRTRLGGAAATPG